MEFLKYKQDNKEYYIEGYLNGDKNSYKNNKILIILKEPNTGNGDVRDKVTDCKNDDNLHFWLRDVVDRNRDGKNPCKTKNDRIGKFYYRRLNKIVQSFFGNDKTIDNCIYMNLSPLWGKSSASDLYGKVLMALKKDKTKEQVKYNIPEIITDDGIKEMKEANEEELARGVIDNRMSLIEDLVSREEIDTIVTVPGIYERLKRIFSDEQKDKQEWELVKHSGFRKCEILIKNKQIKLYRVYHPKARYKDGIFDKPIDWK